MRRRRDARSNAFPVASTEAATVGSVNSKAGSRAVKVREGGMETYGLAVESLEVAIEIVRG